MKYLFILLFTSVIYSGCGYKTDPIYIEKNNISEVKK